MHLEQAAKEGPSRRALWSLLRGAFFFPFLFYNEPSSSSSLGFCSTGEVGVSGEVEGVVVQVSLSPGTMKTTTACRLLLAAELLAEPPSLSIPPPCLPSNGGFQPTTAAALFHPAVFWGFFKKNKTNSAVFRPLSFVRHISVRLARSYPSANFHSFHMNTFYS